ncbi:hypothetical protein [Mucilaginibacter sp.]|uniref:hypothetical protein n=1 Tax=Mucilaginibacter sp. TaxID=1882438 RepID=UPI002ECFAEE9
MKEVFLNIVFTFLRKFYLKVNHKRSSIYVYTDSRGYNVISRFGKTPLGSYIQRLLTRYKVTYNICPEKFTTIVDFISLFQTKENWKNYDFVIMHCGVVDFSPRPLSNIEKVKGSKKNDPIFDELFKANEVHQTKYLGPKYNNEEIVTLYSEAYFESHICPILQKIENLIWIDSNMFVKGWEGNFTKGRPENIQTIVNSYDAILAKYIKNKISIKDWTPDEIKRYTIDNIHFTSLGFKELTKRIIQKLDGADRAN